MGLATIYEAKTGAEFGQVEREYRDAEAKARKGKKGIWSLTKGEFESPREYKVRTSSSEDTKDKTKDMGMVEDVGASWWSCLRTMMFSKR